MKTFYQFAAAAVVCAGLAAAAPQWDRLFRKPASRAALKDDKIVAGLKEALRVGADNSVTRTGRLDGFFGNAAIRILLPEPVRRVEKVLRATGMGPKLDEFDLSMNRAAENAAGQANGIFVDAIRRMTIEDGRRILTGGDTAATEFLKARTTESLTVAFRPIVQQAMEKVEVTRRYKQLTGGLPGALFGRRDAFDLDSYVVARTLDGLFFVIGEEERKIRKDPLAQVSVLLKEVFGAR